jgi:hypothetical protein
MKLPCSISPVRRRSASLLVQCLVYIAVFGLLLGFGTAAFYFCWDHTKAVIYAVNDIESALRAGEGWRADVRRATGKISVENTSSGVVARIPAGENEIIYRFAAGELRREIPARHISRLLLDKVAASAMKADEHGSVRAWRWELELTPRRQETQLPLAFTFAAAQTPP